MDITKDPNGSVSDSNGTRKLYDICINGCVFAQAVEGCEADEIINEHDTLKAKAELLGEAETQYQRLWNHLAHYIRMFEDMYPTAKSPAEMWDAYEKMGKVMGKSKELK